MAIYHDLLDKVREMICGVAMIVLRLIPEPVLMSEGDCLSSFFVIRMALKRGGYPSLFLSGIENCSAILRFLFSAA